jgi:hypothetical protein
MTTGILHFIPQLKLHHVVFISNHDDNKNPTNKNECINGKYNSIFLVDFTPINQTTSKTLLKLLFAQNVPGEIRIRHLLEEKKLSLEENDIIIEIWTQMNNLVKETNIDSQKLSDLTYNKIHNQDIKNFIGELRKWNTIMNLYNNNCIHFSDFANKQVNLFIHH